MTEDNDTIAVTGADTTGFGQLFDRHARVVFVYLARRTDRTVAEDLLSETFLVAFEGRQRFEPERADALPWLLGIATNLLRRHRRQEVRAYRAFARSAAPGESDDVQAAGDRLDMQRSLTGVAEALRTMPAAVRDTVLLFAWAELTYEQVAEATGVPIGTVRSRMSRARRRLRDVPGALTTLTGDHHG